MKENLMIVVASFLSVAATSGVLSYKLRHLDILFEILRFIALLTAFLGLLLAGLFFNNMLTIFYEIGMLYVFMFVFNMIYNRV